VPFVVDKPRRRLKGLANTRAEEMGTENSQTLVERSSVLHANGVVCRVPRTGLNRALSRWQTESRWNYQRGCQRATQQVDVKAPGWRSDLFVSLSRSADLRLQIKRCAAVKRPFTTTSH